MLLVDTTLLRLLYGLGMSLPYSQRLYSFSFCVLRGGRGTLSILLISCRRETSRFALSFPLVHPPPLFFYIYIKKNPLQHPA